MIYLTYFGGTKGESVIKALSVDATGNMYVTGDTCASDFPETLSLHRIPISCTSPPAISGAFLTKIASTGDRIVYSAVVAGQGVQCGSGSTCFLTERFTSGLAIAVDPKGNAYMAGYTNTIDLPTTSGALLTQGIGAFVAKVDASGSGLKYLTYIGATNYIVMPYANPASLANAIAVDADGNAFIAGSTTDAMFPATPGAYQTTFSGSIPSAGPPPPSDAFVAKLNPDGSSLAWATYLGGTGTDSAQSIAIDGSGNVRLAGTTDSAKFPNANGWSQGGDFLVEFNSSGSALLYSARYPNDTTAQGIAIDPTGLIHVVGSTGFVSVIQPSQPPTMRIFATANAAGGPVSGRTAPGELISLYGPHIGPASPVSFSIGSSGLVATSLGGVQLLFNGVLAPLLYVSDSQINAIVPFSLVDESAVNVQLFSSGTTSPDLRLATVPFVPEVFQQSPGYAAAINQDGTANSHEHPAPVGSIVSIWATGMTAIPTVDGEITASAQDESCCEVVSIQGGEVLYAGAAPGFVAGVSQINFRVLPIPYATTTYQYTVVVQSRYGSKSGESEPFLIYVSP